MGKDRLGRWRAARWLEAPFGNDDLIILPATASAGLRLTREPENGCGMAAGSMNTIILKPSPVSEPVDTIALLTGLSNRVRFEYMSEDGTRHAQTRRRRLDFGGDLSSHRAKRASLMKVGGTSLQQFGPDLT